MIEAPGEERTRPVFFRYKDGNLESPLNEDKASGGCHRF